MPFFAKVAAKDEDLDGADKWGPVLLAAPRGFTDGLRREETFKAAPVLCKDEPSLSLEATGKCFRLVSMAILFAFLSWMVNRHSQLRKVQTSSGDLCPQYSWHHLGLYQWKCLS